MKNIRIIPQLNIKGHNVVKPVSTEGLKVVGNPKELAQRYYMEGADEIIYLDVVASLYQRNLDFDQLKKVCAGIFIPFTVGGGIRSIADINNALRAGADKIAINTYAVHNPDFLSQATRVFGSQCIVLYVEAKKINDGEWEAYTDGGREKTGVAVIPWIKKAIALGIGEILITSIDQDGTRRGYDIDLMKRITSFSPVPVIAHGGARTPESIQEVVDEGRVDAVSISSILHYNEYLIPEIKKYLRGNNFNIRLL